MSKIGNKPIPIPENTKVTIEKELITISGREGEISVKMSPLINVVVTDNNILVSQNKKIKSAKALQGTYRSLVSNAVEGVNSLWTRKLEVVGTGYRVKQDGENLQFEIGFSHKVPFTAEGVKLAAEGNKVIVSGTDKQLVGQAAHRIRILKKPDPYKGKGIRYEGERIKLKPGKKAKSAEGAK